MTDTLIFLLSGLLIAGFALPTVPARIIMGAILVILAVLGLHIIR